MKVCVDIDMPVTQSGPLSPYFWRMQIRGGKGNGDRKTIVALARRFDPDSGLARSCSFYPPKKGDGKVVPGTMTIMGARKSMKIFNIQPESEM